MPDHAPLTLLILDGWGHREAASDNAIACARTPNWDQLWEHASHTLLNTSGTAVGLPDGQMGNSEVGHMNIGAGRIVYQELTRIDQAVADGQLPTNPALEQALETAVARGSCVHVLGLLSDGGVHSHEDHFLAVLDMALHTSVPAIAVHAFLDGRDTPPRSAGPSIARLEALLANDERAVVASVCGRYYAMDRDQRWERTERAWQALVEANATYQAATASAALAQAYERDETDEFVEPTLVAGGRRIADDDVVIFINFRADRARQLTRALCDPDFDGFERRQPKLATMVTMTRYQADMPCQVAFEPNRMTELFGEVVARAGLRQLRIAETEKYAHVTYFFNGGEETEFPGEERILVPSPKVATYDLQPQMSAPELARRLAQAIRDHQFEVIVANVANPDMVGHSGNFEAAIKAVEAVDVLLGEVIAATRAAGGELLVTADHGNIEQMSDPESGQVHTAHTTNPVPLVFLGQRDCRMLKEGSLRDIAPTMLKLLGLDIPAVMTGQSLIDCSE